MFRLDVISWLEKNCDTIMVTQGVQPLSLLLKTLFRRRKDALAVYAELNRMYQLFQR